METRVGTFKPIYIHNGNIQFEAIKVLNPWKTADSISRPVIGPREIWTITLQDISRLLNPLLELILLVNVGRLARPHSGPEPRIGLTKMSLKTVNRF